ncbi:MAG: cutinase family protein [Gordonia sp. (in: high G+C Gram-positive bacteria)]
MFKRSAVLFYGVLLTLTGLAAVRPATADAACSDVAVVFARGTAETAPPLGITGLAFANDVRNRLRGKSVNVSAVNYPASSDFDHRTRFVENIVTGVRDTQRQVVSLSRRCPKTRIVVGGYSQGAAVAAYALSERIVAPAQYQRYQEKAPKPLPDDVASHVAAVVLFAPPSAAWIRQLNAPPMTVGPHYRGRSKSYCIPGDIVCNGAPVGRPNALHVLYSVNGMTADAAQFVARKL